MLRGGKDANNNNKKKNVLVPFFLAGFHEMTHLRAFFFSACLFLSCAFFFCLLTCKNARDTNQVQKSKFLAKKRTPHIHKLFGLAISLLISHLFCFFFL